MGFLDRLYDELISTHENEPNYAGNPCYDDEPKRVKVSWYGYYYSTTGGTRHGEWHGVMDEGTFCNIRWDDYAITELLRRQILDFDRPVDSALILSMDGYTY